jgi:hypothetical protein
MAWASPCSLVGLAFAAIVLLCGGRARRVGGTLEVSVRRNMATARWPLRALPFGAITLGHVIVGATPQQLERLRAHERVHVRQYERWGLAFFVAYPAASLWQLLRGRRPYWDNPFEVQARVLSGARENPLRP